MSVSSSSVAEILAKHVTLELECIDRMYCNVYVPRLQRDASQLHHVTVDGLAEWIAWWDAKESSA